MTVEIGRTDLVAMAGLVAITSIELAPGLAPDGWHSDDSWVVESVVHADSLREFISLGFTHPGFNAAVRLIARENVEAPALFQLLPLGAGLIAVCVLYLLAKTITRSSGVAFLTTLPLATSWLFFRYANAVKPYTIELLLYALVLFAIAKTDRLPKWWLPAWIAALAPVTFLSFRLIFISICAAGALWWCRRIQLRQLVILGVAHAAIVGPWALFLRTQYNVESVKLWWIDNENAFITWNTSAPTQILRQVRNASRVLIDLPGDRLQWLVVLLILAGAIDGILRRDPTESAAAAGLALAITGSAISLLPFGPMRIDGERIDLWLMPAFLVLALRGGILALDVIASIVTRILGPTWRDVLRRVPGPIVAGAMGLVILTPVVAQLTNTPYVYPHRHLEENLAFALDRALTPPGGLIVGSTQVPVHVAALFPQVVADVSHDAGHPRGIRIDLQRGLFLRVDRALANPASTEAFERIVVVDVQVSEQLLDSLDDQLRSQGFRPVPNQGFPRVEVWERPPG